MLQLNGIRAQDTHSLDQVADNPSVHKCLTRVEVKDRYHTDNEGMLQLGISLVGMCRRCLTLKD